MNEMNIVVSICMITYNHEKYIAQAIDSVLMQKSNFDYEIVIGEDCSTDRTREIVLEYKVKHPDKIKLLLQDKNVGMMPNFIETLRACTGKYIAILEGDDYWTDTYKLQKQVDFLEINSDYGLVFTDATHLDEQTGKMITSYDKTFKRNIPVGEVLETLIYNNPYKTCTAMFRKDYLSDFEEINNKIKKHLIKMGDKILWLIIAKKKNVGYIPLSTATYRIQRLSASHFQDIKKIVQFGKSNYKVSLFFAMLYKLPINRTLLKSNYREYIVSKCITDGHYLYLKHFLYHPYLIIKILIKEKIVRKLII
jgi:glycosyltransferase involved in cell wall biosynthesis